MEIQVVSHLTEHTKQLRDTLLKTAGIQTGDDADSFVFVWELDILVAVGARKENLLKYIAVNPDYRGEDLTATVLSALKKDAFSKGYKHLLLFTKPSNKQIFSSLFFYPIAETENVLLMEDKKDGIKLFLESLPADTTAKKVGAVVMNCDPFTNGHLHLIKTAAKECDRLYVFVVSEDKGYFSAEQRFSLVKAETKNLKNVTVLPTGPYLISSATFPTYFLKGRDNAKQIQCQLDIEIFIKYFVSRFSINHRFVGSEPFSELTAEYNRTLKQNLPKSNISLIEIPRLEKDGTPISASAVRKFIKEGKINLIKPLVPKTTFEFIKGE